MPNGIDDELEETLDEILAAAALLRKAAHAAPRSRRPSVPATGVLALLQRRPGLTVPQLARQRGTSRQNIQVLVDRLSEAGHVQHVANPDHVRSERLQLTPAGKRSLTAANAHRTVLLGKLVPHVTGQELRTCLSVMKRLREHLGSQEIASGVPITETKRRSRQGGTSASTAAPNPPAQQDDEPPVEVWSPTELPVNLL